MRLLEPCHWTALVLMTLTTFGSAPASAGHLRLGDTLPAIALPRLGGDETVSFATLHGQVGVVAFYSPFCEPCHKMLPVLLGAVADVAAATGVRVPILVIALDGEPAAELVAKLGNAVVWLRDPNGVADRELDPEVRPCTYLIDPTGTIRHINRGYGKGYGARVGQWLKGMVDAKLAAAGP